MAICAGTAVSGPGQSATHTKSGYVLSAKSPHKDHVMGLAIYIVAYCPGWHPLQGGKLRNTNLKKVSYVPCGGPSNRPLKHRPGVWYIPGVVKMSECIAVPGHSTFREFDSLVGYNSVEFGMQQWG